MRVALVTGGARGIGAAIVEEFSMAGYHVAFTYLGSAEIAGTLAERLTTEERQAVAFQADVKDFDRAEQVVHEVAERLGPIDVLVNNAGVRRDGLFHRMAPEDWRDVIETNLTGTFNYTRSIALDMAKRGGSVINIGSVSGLSGLAGQVNYSASKAGLVGMTKALAKELGRFNVRVNVIAPGMIETDMTDSMNERAREKLIKQIPLGRQGGSAEVARLAVYLASADAAYITGQVYTIDGGLS